jgi:hypothetical protein
MPSSSRAEVRLEIAQQIFVLRGQRVMLDADLARLYGVATSRLNEQVRRNPDRFPEDFAFRLTKQELAILMSHFAISSWGGGRKSPPVFTEHGAIMAATVLSSARAAEMAVFVVRAFVKLRQVLESNSELARKLAALERSVAMLDTSTRKQFDELYTAIRALMAPPAAKSRPIGFTADLNREP